MAAVGEQLLTLLDPDNYHRWTEAQFNSRLFIRFENNQRCLAHLQTLANVAPRWIHFFLPESEIDFVRTSIRDFNDTRIYLYCRDQQMVDLNRPLIRELALNKIFINDELPYHIHSAAVELLYSLAREAPDQSDEHDEMILAAVNHVQDLRKALVTYEP